MSSALAYPPRVDSEVGQVGTRAQASGEIEGVIEGEVALRLRYSVNYSVGMFSGWSQADQIEIAGR